MDCDRFMILVRWLRPAWIAMDTSIAVVATSWASTTDTDVEASLLVPLLDIGRAIVWC